MKFRKKPVVVEARLFDPGVDYDDACAVVAWCSGRAIDEGVAITTIHGEEAIARPGDWIIAEPTPGRFYPCRPDIFAETYDPAVEAPAGR